jgi:ribosomal protein S18 acetylase RimI-like enzyme
MTRLTIQPLTQLNVAQLWKLVRGYTTTEKYIVTKQEAEQSVSFNLELQTLKQPYQRNWPPETEMEDHYRSILDQGLSLGLYHAEEWVGMAIAEKRDWNRSLWVWEFHIHPDFQGQGWGRKLMEALAQLAIQADCRVMVCETQNTNVPAIRFYRKLGFEVGAVDLSYYTNQDTTDFEVAIFMKRYLSP